MSKVWGNIGAWAAEAERAEAEEKEQAAAAAAAPPQSYPSLKEAVNTNKGKKKKMSLQEFTMAGPGGLGGGGSSRELGFEYKGLTPEEMMRLPTGPKERSPEEMQYGRLGGGFSSYGAGRGGPRMRDRDGDGDGSWGSSRRSYGGFADDRRGPPPRVSEYDQPSRADEVDNWAMAKKPMTPSYDVTRNNRYGSLGGGGGGGVGTGGIGGGFSRADEIDNWAATKKPLPPARSSNFGPGLRSYGGSEPDRWNRGVVPRDGDQERPTERRRLVLDPPRGESSPVEPSSAKTNKPNPFGAARPREEVLAEKGVDWKKVDLEIEAKISSSRPTSSHTNSRPGSAHSASSVEGPAALQGLERTRPKMNPFGDAKPREVLLQEKGIDYRKIDLELERRRVGRSEAEAEKNLREEIDNLKRDFEKEAASETAKENQTSLCDRILQKEKELEQLALELDNKVRFSQKAVERPGSGSGRTGSVFQERPPSQSGSVDDSRSVDFSERPRSRGTRDPWIRTDDRRGFGGGRDRGFLGNRDLRRSNSRERW